MLVSFCGNDLWCNRQICRLHVWILSECQSELEVTARVKPTDRVLPKKKKGKWDE